MTQKTKKGARKAPKEALDASLDLRRAGDMEGAEKALRSLINDYPEDLDLAIVYAGLLFNLRRFTEAISHFERILATNLTSEVASLGLFHSLWASQQKQGAVNEAKRFYAAGGESVEYDELVRRIRDTLSDSEVDEQG
jgi:tetratricopeptide (TPR) repeat protein